MNRIAHWSRRVNWILIAILLLGFGLRLWGIGFGLPYLYHADESVPVSIALKILHTGDLNPNFYHWPSLLFYLNAIVYFVFFLFGRITGRFVAPTDLPFPDIEAMAVGKAAMPELFLLGRGLSVVFGTLSILLVYLLCRKLSKHKAAGWLAALLFAVEPVSVRNSQFIRPDTFAVFFILISVLFALRLADDPQVKNYVFAGIGAGLATSSKYNAALVFIPIVAAQFILFRIRGLRKIGIYLAILAGVVAFVLTTPFAALDWQRFMTIGPLDDARIYATGHPGAEGDTIQWYADFFWSNQGWVIVLALGHVVWTVLRGDKKTLVLLSFTALYLLFINFYTVRFETTAMPILPFTIIMASLFVFRIYDAVKSKRALGYVLRAAAVAVLAIVLTLPPLRTSAENDARILARDGREAAREWLEINLSAGSRIALESYSPYLDPNRFMVSGFYGLQDHAPEWYVSNGYEYLVFSQGVYGRYFADPMRYAAEVNRYNSLFGRFHEVARFDDNGYEVRLLKTGVVLPTHRVAARFGDDGDLVELVGYEESAVKWNPGEPLRVKLYWRTLRDKSEPLQVSLKVVENNGRQVGLVEGDLFQGKGWPEGLFVTEWSVPTSAETSPGLASLQVNVTQTRFAYRTPIFKLGGDRIEELALGPFKLATPPVSAREFESVHKADVSWADQLALVGYMPVNQVVQVGQVLPLTFYWAGRTRPAGDYTFFAHLLDRDGKSRAQIDARPRGGAYPTSIWDAGEVLRDDYELKLPDDLLPGSYRLEIGWYEFPSLIRLVVADKDSWVLPEPVNVVR